MVDKLQDAPDPDKSWSNGEPLPAEPGSVSLEPAPVISPAAARWFGDNEGEATPKTDTKEDWKRRQITVNQMLDFIPGEDPNCVIGERFLCKGSSLVIVAPTHTGKSSLGLQMAMMWALGGDFFGIGPTPPRPLKSVYIQAENDVGDMAEMFKGILLGTGQLNEKDPIHNMAIAEMLEKNLIIIRDQSHTGFDFAMACQQLVDIHKPDIIWGDPFLSYFGSEINDQRECSTFLRSWIGPIAEKTGVIFAFLHHTGKPMKEQSGKSKAVFDYSYDGLGSSELSNWARAKICMVRVEEDEYRVALTKRGWRAGAKDEHGNPTNELYLAHSGENICWKQIPKPAEEDDQDILCGTFARSLGKEFDPLGAKQIVTMAERFLKRGNRTVWKLWDKGNGPLGKHFHRDSDTGLYLPNF